jgi:hypothetical protein
MLGQRFLGPAAQRAQEAETMGQELAGGIGVSGRFRTRRLRRRALAQRRPCGVTGWRRGG